MIQGLGRGTVLIPRVPLWRWKFHRGRGTFSDLWESQKGDRMSHYASGSIFVCVSLSLSQNRRIMTNK